mmetsp:Transcript_656/g.1781  ORF Transcript_656/g.1781 Transcript_656/m.1781 type:complete len:563 (+) Transcript_656:3249-4937(+)
MYFCMSLAPRAQLRPMAKGFTWDTLFQNASFVWPLSVRPLLSTMVPLIMTGMRTPLSAKKVLQSVQGSLGVERVKDGLHEEDVHTAIVQSSRLLIVRGRNLVKRAAAQGRVLHRGRHTQSLVGGANGACDKLGTRLRVLRHVLCGTLLSQLGSMEVDRIHLILGLKLIVSLADCGAVEGVGLNDVSARLKVGSVDLCNDVWPCEHKNVVVAFQLMAVVLVALATEILLLELVALDHGAHGAVNVRNALGEQRLQSTKRLGASQRLLVGRVSGHRWKVRVRCHWVGAGRDGVDARSDLGGGLSVQLPDGRGLALGIQCLCVLQHAVSGILAAVEEHVLHKLKQLLVDQLVLVLNHLGRVDNAHVHARSARVVKEGRVERASHGLVATEAKRNVGDAATDLAARALTLDLTRRTDEVNTIVVVLSQPGANRQHVGIKHNVLRVEANLLHQDAVGALAHANLVLAAGSLARLIKCHHHNSSTVLLHDAGVGAECILALLEADAVDDALALRALQPGLHNLKLAAVNHERHTADLRVCNQQIDKPGHGVHAVDQAVVHVDVQNVGT